MMQDMDWLHKRFRPRIGLRSGWIAAILTILLVALILGVLSRVPVGNPVQLAFNPPIATAIATNAATVTAAPPLASLPAGEIVARSGSAAFKDMSGTETIMYGDGGSTKATIALTSNPARSEEVDSQFDAQGGLIEIDDQIKDAAKRYQRTISYRTNPPTDSGWKLDPQPIPDPRPLSVFLLDPFTDATTFLGTEVINGVSTYYLQVQLSTTSKQEVWIRTDNFYLVQWKETDSFSHALITMTTWDSGVSIALPSV